MSKKVIPRPSYRSPSGRFVLWGDIIRRSKQIPNVWWLVFSDVPAATVQAITYQQHPDLRRADGRLEAELRNPHTNEATGRTTGDLAVRWVPKERDDNENSGGPAESEPQRTRQTDGPRTAGQQGEVGR